MGHARYTLFLLRNSSRHVLLSIDSPANSAVAWFQLDPDFVNPVKSKILLMTISDARDIWRRLVNDGWEHLEKGAIPGTIVQRIKIWIRIRSTSFSSLHEKLVDSWNVPYDGTTESLNCRFDNSDGETKFYVTPVNHNGSDLSGCSEGYSLHSRMGGAFAEGGGELLYIPGSIPRQRGRKMR